MTEYFITIKPSVRYIDLTPKPEDIPVDMLAENGVVDHITHISSINEKPSRTADKLAEQWLAERNGEPSEEVKDQARVEVMRGIAERYPDLYIEMKLKELGAESLASLIHSAEYFS